MFVGYLLLGGSNGEQYHWTGHDVLFAYPYCTRYRFFQRQFCALLGKLYDNPKYSKNRDIAFSIFYMFINISAFFAPSAANYINNAVLRSSNFTYDASIPKNYVILNDEAQAIDKNTFIAQHLTPEEQQLTEKEFEAVLNKAKKEHKVVFMEEIEESLSA